MLTAFAILCITATGECETHYAAFTGNEILCTRHAQLVARDHYREGMTVQRYGCRREG